MASAVGQSMLFRLWGSFKPSGWRAVNRMFSGAYKLLYTFSHGRAARAVLMAGMTMTSAASSGKRFSAMELTGVRGDQLAVTVTRIGFCVCRNREMISAGNGAEAGSGALGKNVKAAASRAIHNMI